MNGEEIEVMKRQVSTASSQFSYNRNIELTPAESMDLMVFGTTPVANLLYRLMESCITDARNEAMECDPAEDKKQRSLMTEAHAMDKFYKKIRGKIEFARVEHLSDVHQKALAEELKDQEKLEEVILANIRREI